MPILVKKSVHQEVSRIGIVTGGICYDWHENAFLSREEAEYALDRLWELVAGTAEWEGEPVITIPAIDERSVRGMFEKPEGMLPWISLQEVLPVGCELSLDTDRLPALCALPDQNTRFSGAAPFPLDLVAATFLMLTRWEELQPGSPKDWKGNDPHEASLAWRQGFLERPVMDEWALVLRHWLQYLVAGWYAKLSPFSIMLSHDIDRIWKITNMYHFLRATVGEFLRSPSFVRTFKFMLNYWRGPFNIIHDLEYRALIDLIDIGELLGQQATFFLMSARPGPFTNGYDLFHSNFIHVPSLIFSKKHMLGFHPGYQAAESPHIFHEEKQRLDEVVGCNVLRCRFHYLRWRHDSSIDMLIDNGIKEDFTLGYNTHLGFRCGTCHPYPLWSFHNANTTNIMEYPLIIQDAAVYTAMGLDPKEGKKRFLTIRKRVECVSGNLTILLHNVPHYWSAFGGLESLKSLCAPQI